MGAYHEWHGPLCTDDLGGYFCKHGQPRLRPGRLEIFEKGQGGELGLHGLNPYALHSLLVVALHTSYISMSEVGLLQLFVLLSYLPI